MVNQVRVLLNLKLCEIFRAAPLELASKMNIHLNHQLEETKKKQLVSMSKAEFDQIKNTFNSCIQCFVYAVH